MKKILAVEIKLMLRDWPSVAFSIVLPVVLLVVLGQIPTLQTPDPAFGGQRFIDAQLPAQMILLALLTISSQVPWNTSRTMPPSAKTMMTIRAAIAATSRPYSTADAPSSLSRRFASCLKS